MKHLTILLTLISLLLLPSSVRTQPAIHAEQGQKLNLAQKLADSVAERFRQTLEFDRVWQEFRVKDDSCSLEMTPLLLGEFSGAELETQSFSSRFKQANLDTGLLRSYHSALWTTWFLHSGLVYSLAPSTNGSEPDLDALERTKTGRFLLEHEVADDDPWIRTNADLKKSIKTARSSAARFKKLWRRDTMNNKNWRSARQWLLSYNPARGVAEARRQPAYCNETYGPRYLAETGAFILEFVEENGRLKLLSLFPKTQ